ncbi:hypothetical protein K435DRAFT_599809, partial [Dendrothele bispora CBS 962.96]
DDEITKMAGSMDLEDLVSQLSQDGDVDNVEGLVDELEEMGDLEREELEESIRPIKLVLVKLRRISFKIINSTTLLLPAWKALLREMEMAEKIIPRDVTTRWNSTYDMTSFSDEYQRPIDAMTANKS